MAIRKEMIYRTLTGRTVDLAKLQADERACLVAVVRKYGTQPEWTQFAAWWTKEVDKRGLDHKSPVFRICDDLEARLGIDQGKASPPDYRHYLLALIEERYGSRYKFCKETGVDQGQLSRILAGQADFSMEMLEKVLRVLHGSLTVQTEEVLRETASPAEAYRVLKAAAP